MPLTLEQIQCLSPQTKHPIPQGFSKEVFLGHGQDTFKAMQEWVFAGGHYPEWAPLSISNLNPGQKLEMQTKLFGFNFELPLQVTDVFKDLPVHGEIWSGYVYATQKGHWLEGAERFLLRKSTDDAVFYEIRSFSWPKKVLAWPGLPIIRQIQKKFLVDSCLRATNYAEQL